VSPLHPRQGGRRRQYRKKFDFWVRRRREIERHACEVGAAHTDDLSRWLIAWVWHNGRSRDQIGAVIECARRMGREGFTPADAEAVVEEASRTGRHMSADNLARFLGVTYALRQRLGLTTIGSVDVGKRARKELRKRKDRLAKERRRREQGARPQSQSLSRTEPWKKRNMSRAKWYRLRMHKTARSETSPSTAEASETTSSTADSLCTADRFVSVEAEKRPSEERGSDRSV
jgi:hypothetical protein